MESIAARWRQGCRWCARAGGLLVAFPLVGLTAACSREPAAKDLRTQDTSPQAASRRAVEEQGMRAVLARLTAVEGLEHVLTRFRDSCARPAKRSVFENNPSPYVLECRMEVDAYFGVRGDITDVLTRFEAADLPVAASSVRYALDFQRAHGRMPDGSLMSWPGLEAAVIRIEWDRPDPLPSQVEEPLPCFPPKDEIYERCSITPKPR